MIGRMEKTGAPSRIFLDFTQTAESPFNTGIQKVMRKLLATLPSVANQFDVEVIPTICSNGEFFRIEEFQKVVPKKFEVVKQNFSSELPNGYHKFAKACSLNGTLKWVEKLLIPKKGHLGIFNIPVKLFCKLRSTLSSVDLPKPIGFGPNDCMILGECYWGPGREIFESALTARERAGLTIQSIIYDLIPMTHRHYFDDHTASHFGAYYRMLVETSDVVTAISQTVRDQIRMRLEDEFTGIPASRIQSFRLGCEIVSKPGKVRQELEEIFSNPNRKMHLVVSTFEPRKNHRTVLDAFEKLWANGSDESLLLAGRVGWGVDDVLERCKRLKNAGYPLKYFHDLTDSEIDFCYRQCSAVIYPSEVEGFGLPIVEGLWHRKPTIVSDTAIHREVGRDDCLYFPTLNSDQLAATLAQVDSDPDRFVADGYFRLTSWQESCSELLGVLVNCLKEKDMEAQKRVA